MTLSMLLVTLEVLALDVRDETLADRFCLTVWFCACCRNRCLAVAIDAVAIDW